MAAKSTSINNLWHQRYGHVNVHYLSQLVWEGLVVGLPEIQTIRIMEFVELVRLESIIRLRFQMVILGEPPRYCSWFM